MWHLANGPAMLLKQETSKRTTPTKMSRGDGDIVTDDSPKDGFRYPRLVVGPSLVSRSDVPRYDTRCSSVRRGGAPSTELRRHRATRVALAVWVVSPVTAFSFVGPSLEQKQTPLNSSFFKVGNLFTNFSSVNQFSSRKKFCHFRNVEKMFSVKILYLL